MSVAIITVMGKTYRDYDPDQQFLMPPSLQDWLPEGHLVYFISDLVDDMDLSGIEGWYEREDRGQPPYHPRMMTKVLLYGYCVGVFSSRRIQKGLLEDVGFRVIGAGNTPDFRTISEFRRIHREALAGLYEQGLKMALGAGAVKLGRVVLDGTKVKANASKHKAMSYGYMEKREGALREEVAGLLERAEQEDAEEDSRYGRGSEGEELPEELRRRETRLERIREAKAALAERAREKAKKEATAGEEGKAAEKAQPKAKDQYNFTDPESRMMKGGDGFVQGYNAQIAVEPKFQLIVGQGVTQEVNDKQQLAPMVEAVREQAGQNPTNVVADNGYCSDDNLKYLEEQEEEILAHIAAGRQKHNEAPVGSPRGRIPKEMKRVDRMRRKLQTKAGKAIYATRKGIVEPVFGQIKQGRGFRQFLLRGVEKVKIEWALVCLGHNILKMHRYCC